MTVQRNNYPQIAINAVFSFVEHLEVYLKYDETIPLKELISKYLLFYLSVSEQCNTTLNSINSEDDKIKQLNNILLKFFSTPRVNDVVEILKITEKHPWYSLLNEHKKHILFYIFNEEQLFKLTPLIKLINSPILLLTEFEICDDTDLPDNVSVLDFDFSLEIGYKNNFIETNFPILYHYLNTFEQLFQLLIPTELIVWGRHLFQQEALFVVAQKHGIKTFCITDKTKNLSTVGHEFNNLYNCFLHNNKFK